MRKLGRGKILKNNESKQKNGRDLKTGLLVKKLHSLVNQLHERTNLITKENHKLLTENDELKERLINLGLL